MALTTRRPAIELQERDLLILRGLFEARVMTLAHLAAFYFHDSVEAATKRVQKLKAAGWLGERPRRAYEPSVLFLTRSAFRILSDRGALASYPRIGWGNIEKRARVSDLTLRHELDVLDVRASLWKALAANRRYQILEFSTWPLLFQFRAAPGLGQPEVLVRPDGFIRIADSDGGSSQHLFFLEVDRSTETQGTLAAKAACYADFYRRGGMAARFGCPREQYKCFPFRVLIAVRNLERRNNAAAQLLKCTPPLLTQAWLTTLEELKADPLGQIWVRPADYRAAVAHTAFNARFPAEPLAPGVYRRQVERELLVERAVRKKALLVPPNQPSPRRSR